MTTIGTPQRMLPDFYVCDINDGPQCVGCAYGATAEEAQRRAAQFAAADEIVRLHLAFMRRMEAAGRGEHIGNIAALYEENAAMTRRMQEIAAMIEPA